MKKNQKNNGNADNLQAGKQRTMRKPLSAFMEASEIKVRQCVYIDKETHDKYANIIRYMGNGITLGRYIDNVLNEHLRQYQNELQEAYYQSIQNAKLFEDGTERNHSDRVASLQRMVHTPVAARADQGNQTCPILVRYLRAVEVDGRQSAFPTKRRDRNQ